MPMTPKQMIKYLKEMDLMNSDSKVLTNFLKTRKQINVSPYLITEKTYQKALNKQC